MTRLELRPPTAHEYIPNTLWMMGFNKEQRAAIVALADVLELADVIEVGKALLEIDSVNDKVNGAIERMRE